MISEFDKEHMGEIIGGYGDWFTAHLLRLIAKADENNRIRLRCAFPDVVDAYMKWYYKPKSGVES